MLVSGILKAATWRKGSSGFWLHAASVSRSKDFGNLTVAIWKEGARANESRQQATRWSKIRNEKRDCACHLSRRHVLPAGVLCFI